jgi:hypothetical protein
LRKKHESSDKRLLLDALLCLSVVVLARAESSQESKNAYRAMSAPVSGIVDVKPPSTYLYANKIAYRHGESLTLTLSQSSNSNSFPYEDPYCSYFLYLEDLQTGEKRYYPHNQPSPVVDMFNVHADPDSGHFRLYRVPTVDNFVWFGASGYMGGARAVPSTPGSYRWVMELRDATGTYIQSAGYAPFTVVQDIEVLRAALTVIAHYQ